MTNAWYTEPREVDKAMYERCVLTNMNDGVHYFLDREDKLKLYEEIVVDNGCVVKGKYINDGKYFIEFAIAAYEVWD